MTGARCACGAVGRLRPPEDGGRAWRMEWRGGRVGVDRLAVEEARTGVVSCPACQHRACVVMLAPASWDDGEEVRG